MNCLILTSFYYNLLLLFCNFLKIPVLYAASNLQPVSTFTQQAENVYAGDESL